MVKPDRFTKVLAILGTGLAWLPLVAPLVFGVLHFTRSGRFMVDYLMPAELFLVALAGGGLLLWSALRARSYRGLIAGGLAAAAALLGSSLAFAQVTGLASGETEPGGWAMVLVLVGLVVYTLALAAVGVGGGLLVRALFRRPATPSASA